MKKLLFLLLALPAFTLNAQDITGKWYGKAAIGAQSLRMIFDIESDGEHYSAKMQSPDQSNQWIPATSVSYVDSVLVVAISNIGLTYTGTLKSNGSIEGKFTQSGMTFELNFNREEIVVRRPQEPLPKYPYIIEEVTFRNEEADVTLAGTLTKPYGNGPFPAVILVTGSGPQDRDESIAGHKPFWIIANHLTLHGITVLRYDERGVGESTGNYGAAGIPEFAADALKGIEYLRSRRDVAPGKVGLIGHSEGGAIAMLLASEQKTDFIVSLAGPGIDGKNLLDQQRIAIMTASGATEAYIREYNRLINEVIDAMEGLDDPQAMQTIDSMLAGTILETGAQTLFQQLSSPQFRSIIAFDPAEYYPAIPCPVLALNGEKDLQVPAGPNLEAIRNGLAHNPNVTVKEYPRLNHLFQTSDTGLPAEYGAIEETFNPAVLRDITEWILKTVD